MCWSVIAGGRIAATQRTRQQQAEPATSKRVNAVMRKAQGPVCRAVPRQHANGPGCHELAAAVRRCTAAGSSLSEYIVFGSSLGWLCFYAALSLSVHAVGYEIVEPLVAKAQLLRLRHCSAGDAACSIDFHCQVSRKNLFSL